MPSQFAVDLAAVVRHLRVPLRAHGVDGEHVAVAPVVKRVEDDLEHVARAGVLKSFFSSLTMMSSGEASWANTPMYMCVIVVQHADVGLIRCRFAFARIVLDESGRDRGGAPRPLVEGPVDADRRRRAHRFEPVRIGTLSASGELAAAKQQEEGGDERDRLVHRISGLRDGRDIGH